MSETISDFVEINFYESKSQGRKIILSPDDLDLYFLKFLPNFFMFFFL
jgi:hypothetical protein